MFFPFRLRLPKSGCKIKWIFESLALKSHASHKKHYKKLNERMSGIRKNEWNQTCICDFFWLSLDVYCDWVVYFILFFTWFDLIIIANYSIMDEFLDN